MPKACPKFAELYIFNTKNEIENRIKALKMNVQMK
jgi:hypothetical protein